MARAYTVRLGAGSGYPLALNVGELRGLSDSELNQFARALALSDIRGQFDATTQQGNRFFQLLESRGLLDVMNPGLATGPVSHGKLITTSNTGWAAYNDPTLGRFVTSGDLTNVSSPAVTSDFTTTGGVILRKRFLTDVRIDVPNVTFVACEFQSFVSSYRSGIETQPSQFNWCKWDPPSVVDLCVGTTGTSLYRCSIRGGADGFWINGGTAQQSIVESYVRVKMASAFDHNDCGQNSGGSGSVTIQRCNMSAAPEGGVINGGAQGGPDSCILSADMTSSTHYYLEIIDSYFDGATAVETIRFYDGGLTPNITYKGTGNRFVRGTSAPIGRGVANTTPTGQIIWTGNVYDDNDATVPLA